MGVCGSKADEADANANKVSSSPERVPAAGDTPAETNPTEQHAALQPPAPMPASNLASAPAAALEIAKAKGLPQRPQQQQAHAPAPAAAAAAAPASAPAASVRPSSLAVPSRGDGADDVAAHAWLESVVVRLETLAGDAPPTEAKQAATGGAASLAPAQITAAHVTAVRFEPPTVRPALT